MFSFSATQTKLLNSHTLYRRKLVEMEGLDMKMFFFSLMALLCHKVEAEMKEMDLAPDAVDYDFSECRDEMLKAVTGADGLLQKELSADEEFKTLWSKNYGACRKNIPGGTSDHMQALHVYANSKTPFRKRFNDLVQRKGTNATTFRDGFPFKALYFLLMDSMRLLNSSRCGSVYYSTKNTYRADTGAEFRFGRFMRALKSKSSATEIVEEEGRGTLFSITSCYVVNVEENTCKSEEVQYIISPTEVFRVGDVRDLVTDEGTYKEITLHHERFLSNPNCSFIQKSDRSSAGSSAPLLTFKTLPVLMFLTMAIHQLMFLL